MGFRYAATLSLLHLVVATPVLNYRNFSCPTWGFKGRWLTTNRIIVECDTSFHDHNGNLLVSEDYGITWSDIKACGEHVNCVKAYWPEDSDHLIISTNTEVAFEEWNVGSADKFLPATVDKKGATFKKIVPHPVNGNWAVALGFVRDVRTLFLTKDYGSKFTALAITLPEGEIINYALWGARSGGNFHENHLFIVTLKRSWGNVYRYDIKTGNLVLFKKHAYYMKNIGKFNVFFVSDRDGQSLYVSNSNGQRIEKAVFPSAELKSFYYVIRLSEGDLFVAVRHVDCSRNTDEVPWGRLYRSDQSGESFSISLHNIRYDIDSNTADFHAVAGLTGVFIANVALVEEENCKKCADVATCNACYFMTKISWDNGDERSWTQLNPPEDLKKTCSDQTKCHLHLHDSASGFAYMMRSKIDSPGVVMGHGNVGAVLETENMNDAHVFLTMNAGDTWRKVLSGPHFYDWANYGGVLLAAPSNKEVSTLRYSVDFGYSWEDIKLNGVFMIRRILVAGGEKGDPQVPIFSVIAEYAQDENTKVDLGVTTLFTVDLTFLQKEKGKCDKVPAKPSDVTRDGHYQTFIPRSFKSGGAECFMGAKIEYIQRKPKQKCWNPETVATMEEAFNVQKCKCSWHDYECDSGFRRKPVNAIPNSLKICESEEVQGPVWSLEDKRFLGGQDQHVPLSCNWNKKYFRTKGYRLKAGNKCDPEMEGSVNLVAVQAKCPPVASRQSSSAVAYVFLAVFFFLCFGVALIYVLALLGNERAVGWKDTLEACVRSCTSFMKESVTGSYRPVVIGGVELDVDSNDDDFRDAADIQGHDAHVTAPPSTIE